MTAPHTLMVSVVNQVAFIKISGRATLTSSADFKTLVKELQQRGYVQFVLDLTDCLIMDSTFLGVLAGFAFALAETPGAQPAPQAALVNPNTRIVELLENFGVIQLFKIAQAPAPLSDKYEPLVQATGNPSKEEIAQTSLEAHQTLMDLNPANIPKFKEVADFLAEDLKKLKK